MWEALDISNHSFVRLNNLGLKYQRCILPGCNDIGIRKHKFVTKTQFLLQILKTPLPPPPLLIPYPLPLALPTQWNMEIINFDLSLEL